MDLEILKKPLDTLWKYSKHELARNTWVIEKIREELNIDLLKDDFRSIYAHALLEYSLQTQSEKIWVDFFRFKDTATLIKDHLYKKYNEEITQAFDGLLHKGKGQVFLNLKNIGAQTGDVIAEYEKLKKHLDHFTEKSRKPADAQHYKQTQEISEKIDKQHKEIKEELDQIKSGSEAKNEEEIKNTDLFTKYEEDLAKLYLENVFNEQEMRLKDIYVEPAFRIQNANGFTDLENINIHQYLHQFLKDKDGSHFIFVLGQPGQGKTSFCKRMLYDLLSAGEERLFERVYFLRFQNILNITDLINKTPETLQQEIEEELETNLIKHSPFKKSLLILDGLDEINLQTGVGIKQINEMCDNLIKFANKNQNKEAKKKTDPYIIVTCRSNYLDLNEYLSKNVNILHLKSFCKDQQKACIKNYQRCSKASTNWFNKSILEEKLFNEKKNYKFISELLGEPLILYLITKLGHKIKKNSNRAELYEILFEEFTDIAQSKFYDSLFGELVDKNYDNEGNGRPNHLKALNKNLLRQITREIALEMFQSGKNFLRLDKLEENLKENDAVKKYQSKIEESLKESLRGISVVFYFEKRSDENDEDYYTIEFLHKSLKDYLIAENIFHKIESSFIKDGRYNEKYKVDNWYEALEIFCSLFAHPYRLNPEITEYLVQIIANRDNVLKSRLFEGLVLFLPIFLKKGFLDSYESKNREGNLFDLANNTFYGYLTVLSHLQEGKSNYDLKETKKYFADFLRTSEHYQLNIPGIDLSETDLTGAKLHGANLSNTILNNARLTGADLSKAKMIGTHLIQAKLTGTDLKGAILKGAILSEANLSGVTSFERADFEGADLQKADLKRVIFTGTDEKKKGWIVNLLNADLRNADLSEASLANPNLKEATNLDGIILKKVNLRGFDLSKKILTQADLTAADLRECNLHKADLSKATLLAANLSNANLSNAILTKAELSKSNLIKADLTEADFSEADLSHSDLSGATLVKTKFNGTVLKSVILSGNILKEVHLIEASLDKANLKKAYLNEVDFSGAKLKEANLEGVSVINSSFSKAELDGANLSGADLNKVDMSEADLSGADLSKVKLDNIIFDKTILRETVLQKVNLSNCKLADIDLSGADLSEANLSGADLNKVDLSGANLSEANLSKANLTEANLSGANLSGADLDGANLSKAVLSRADLSKANLSNTILQGVVLSEIKSMKNAILIKADLSNYDLTEFDLNGANLNGVILHNANLTNAKLGEADLSGANLSEAILTMVSMRKAKLKGANLQNSKLNVAYLRETDLESANLKNADLTSANLMDANIISASLETANLEQADLRTAKIQKTILNGIHLKNAMVSNTDWFQELKKSYTKDSYWEEEIRAIDKYMIDPVPEEDKYGKPFYKIRIIE